MQAGLFRDHLDLGKPGQVREIGFVAKSEAAWSGAHSGPEMRRIVFVRRSAGHEHFFAGRTNEFEFQVRIGNR
jgi:hypothetical protein